MTSHLPAGARIVADRFPDVWSAYAALGAATGGAGGLTARERRLVKLALAIGAGSEGATHSHVRRGMAEGIGTADLEQVALLAIGPCGLPRAVAALTWIGDDKGDGAGDAGAGAADRRPR